MGAPLVVATSATGPGGLPPWWLLHNVKPAGPPKNQGTWTSVTFSKEQQAEFAVDEFGEVVNQEKFEEALQQRDTEKEQPSSRRLMVPPWWVIHGVKPEGKPKNMGSWTASTFSEEQQKR